MLEIQVPSEARKEQITKLEEVCWTRPIPVNARVNIYLVGIFSCLNFPFLVNHADSLNLALVPFVLHRIH